MVNQRRECRFSLDEVVGTVCTRFQITAAKLKAPGKIRPMTEARAVAAAIVQESSHLRLTDLAKLTGRDVSALSKAARYAAADERVSAAVGEITELLYGSGRMSETQT
jgi:chromosomal replication initiation ATPase DnaA